MKKQYEEPILTRHEKLLDITGNFGSGSGSGEGQPRGKVWKEGKEWYKEGKDGW